MNLPDTLLGICEGAFSGCTSLKSVTIPESVIMIQECAFEKCQKLSSVTILNPECQIAEGKNTFTSQGDFFIGVFHGYEGSTTQDYAKNNGRGFVALSNPIPGDLNSDGKIDVTDLTILSVHVLCKKEITAETRKAADVDRDGNVNLTDVAGLRQYLSKKIEKF